MENIWDNIELVELLQKGGVAVMPTDTIYGIVGKAEFPETVERIYKIRKRDPDKACIILIADESELDKFDIKLSKIQKEKFKEYSGTLTSIIVDCPSDRWHYLHKGMHTLGFRVPIQKSLENLLRKVGPLIAPSANLSGKAPAKKIKEAEEYFGNDVDMYVGTKDMDRKPSKIIRLFNDGTVAIIRE